MLARTQGYTMSTIMQVPAGECLSQPHAEMDRHRDYTTLY
jgi:hypothetical protein